MESTRRDNERESFDRTRGDDLAHQPHSPVGSLVG
eukprot:SAG31_NODE_46132_length_255_cov_2.948718_2_plen_34_part_01